MMPQCCRESALSLQLRQSRVVRVIRATLETILAGEALLRALVFQAD